jgi:mono/diheme cytochrome c family protein
MRFRTAAVVSVIFLGGRLIAAADDAKKATSTIPRAWDEAGLAAWATPLAGLNLRPTHISAKDYYSLRVENLRTYPVYFPGREPSGYWERLQQIGPKPLIEPRILATEADWIQAGRIVFDEADDLHLRTFDARFIAEARNRERLEQARTRPLPDGTIVGMRWVPTKRGVALSFSNCSFCHVRYLADGTRVPGAPFKTVAPRWPETFRVWPLISRVQFESRVVTGATPFLMGQEPLGMWLYRAYGVPWLKDDVNDRLKALSKGDYEALDIVFRASGGIPRWNGSLYYPAKIPDLIGVKDRKYLDHTATHLHRGTGDLMRYAALISFADTADFGPYHMVAGETKRVESRLPDEALYALALYIYSLQPPHNSNPFDDKARAGQKIFTREGCAGCHTPPLYTNNRLTLAPSFEPPQDAPGTLDILRRSVGTDAALALKTRKGTGYYKVPSLKGLWYRGHYLHDGSVASLEEMFDPDRLKETHVPGGWRPLGAKSWAIRGHRFGLKLTPDERQQLIAFLRTL